MINEAIILAGGFGTRLNTISSEIPKAMAPVNGRPFLEYLLDYLASQGIESAILSTGYLAGRIEEHFGKSYHGISLAYNREEEPLGTGGGIFSSMKLAASENPLILNGDTLFRVDIVEMYRLHLERRSDITIALRQVADASRYGSVITDGRSRIRIFREKEGKEEPGLVNGGVYIMRRSLLSELDLPEKFSLEDDLFRPATQMLELYGFESQGYFIDIGTPGDYEKAGRDLA